MAAVEFTWGLNWTEAIAGMDRKRTARRTPFPAIAAGLLTCGHALSAVLSLHTHGSRPAPSAQGNDQIPAFCPEADVSSLSQLGHRY